VEKLSLHVDDEAGSNVAIGLYLLICPLSLNAELGPFADVGASIPGILGCEEYVVALTD